MKTTTANQIEFTRINNDINGNPRYVCHFLAFINEVDENTAKLNTSDPFQVSTEYNIALNKARKLGGRKFSNKQYGGGIVFQSYNTHKLNDLINEAAALPTFLKEWDSKQFRKVKAAIREHFKYATLNTNKGKETLFCPSMEYLEDFLGLAYTSTSSYAGLWVCNIAAENPIFPGFHYMGFALGTDGEVYAVLSDESEKETIFRI